MTEAPLTAEAVDWFIRLQTAAGDPATACAFRAWLDSDPGHAEAFADVAEVWGAPELLLATRNVAGRTGYTPPRRQRPGKGLRKKGAIVATSVVLLLGALQLPDVLLRLRSDYVTDAGQRRVVDLPDGSAMTMNSGTAVSLDFAEGRRHVRILKGEAYFDVRSMPDSPFKVEGQYGRVVVKGTAFDVKLAADNDNVVLSRGVVDVARLADPSEHALLAPGEAVSITASGVTAVTRVDPERSLAWLGGRISFSDQPLGRVLDDLRRHYAGRVFVMRDGIEQVSVSGNYRLDQPLLVIESLAQAAGASVTVLPGGIVILR
ncbi:iron dicitrate transporter FecR [Azorhizobium oxalatiphilum]|uniref:Iron dicitrate transporter FecR n=1 Tax=Azorhizobium oxalatiphilum TaxID=980631 RepID=A0A917BXW8_9HYPH|nr:FecR domain-containing protein [Azorhizobium oxalatiphilum]GGF62865.1 iron dicitrate transporter FecR [Azorhizobium oxalatiphilum]